MRKLPSALNLQILNAVRSQIGEAPEYALTSPLTSTPLLAILNGSFDEANTNGPFFGWTTRGDRTVLNGQARLSEDSPFLSNFTQTFTLPDSAKLLQFTLVDAQLGASKLAPPDAFEVALLDANTLTPLAGTATGLTHTDAFFKLQANGDIFLSDTVKSPGANNSTPRTVSLDISYIAPDTEVTLSFDLR